MSADKQYSLCVKTRVVEGTPPRGAHRLPELNEIGVVTSMSDDEIRMLFFVPPGLRLEDGPRDV